MNIVVGRIVIQEEARCGNEDKIGWQWMVEVARSNQTLIKRNYLIRTTRARTENECVKIYNYY